MGSIFGVIGPSHLTSLLEDNIIVNAIDYTPQPGGKTLLIKYHTLCYPRRLSKGHAHLEASDLYRISGRYYT